MAGMLVLNGADGKPMADHGVQPSMPDPEVHKEIILCGGCHATYTLAHNNEYRIQEGRNVVDAMSENAKTVIAESHPAHGAHSHVWAGIHKGWLDGEQATAAGM